MKYYDSEGKVISKETYDDYQFNFRFNTGDDTAQGEQERLLSKRQEEKDWGDVVQALNNKGKESMNEEQETNPKKAHGALKCPSGFTPKSAILEMGAVMAHGAHKYGAFNFRDTDIDCLTYIGAIDRHQALWEDGEDFDEETGYHHLASVMACCALIIDATQTGKLVDNRSKTGLIKATLKRLAQLHNEFVEDWEGLTPEKETRLAPGTVVVTKGPTQ